MNYNDARDFIIKTFAQDIIFYNSGNSEHIGTNYDYYDPYFPREYKQLTIAWEFWSAWIDERNHRFPGFYKGIQQEDWPKLAQHIVAKLSKNEDISHPLILRHFDPQVKTTIVSRTKNVLVGSNSLFNILSLLLVSL